MIEKRISYRFGGGYQGVGGYGRSSSSSSPSSSGGKPGPGDTGGAGGNDRDTRQFSTPSDDRREQYSVQRTVTPVTQPVSETAITKALTTPPQQIIGGESYDVIPETKEEREAAAEEQRQLSEIEKKQFIYEPAKYPAYIPAWMQILANFNREPNRRFFAENVLRGKYGTDLLTSSLGTDVDGLSFTPSGLTEEQYEKAYQDYMQKRMSGEIDAYGNRIVTQPDGPTIQSPLEQVLMAQQQAAEADPLAGLSELEKLILQYRRNLGYTI